jgi:hypothetical protein
VKLGIPLLVIGVLMLVFSIPLSIIVLFGGFSRLTQGIAAGGILAYAPLAAVIAGMVMTTIGATRVFKD